MVYISRPTSSFGYYRGAPLAGGQGGGEGPAVQGLGTLAGGQGNSTGPGGMHPTVLYMLGLVIAEMVVFAFIAKKI